MNDKRQGIPSNRIKQSQCRQKENSSDTAIPHRSRLMKYQTDSMPRQTQKPQSIHHKLSRHEKELLLHSTNNNITYYNIPNTKGINKTAIGTEYNASQKFLKIFPDSIDTRLGIGDILMNDDTILLTDSNLINDMIPNNIIDSNELSNAKLSFNEWNLKIMSSTNSKKGGSFLESSSNPKIKLNEVIANVAPFDNNFQTNKFPLPHQAFEIVDEEENNFNITHTQLNSGNESNEAKKCTKKLYKNHRNINNQMLSKILKTNQSHSFHNDSSSGRTTVNSLNNNSNNNNKNTNHILPHKQRDHFNNINTHPERIAKKNNSKEHQISNKSKDKFIESKSKDTILTYLKILFGDQLESFNEKVLDGKLVESSLKDLFKQLAFFALNQENVIKELTKQNKRKEKELNEKNQENIELSTQLTDIKSNLIELIESTDKITNKKTNRSNKSLNPQQKNGLLQSKQFSH